MGFFEEMTGKLSAAGQEAYKAAKDLAGVGKLNLKLAEESGKLDEMYEMLGRTVYDAKKNGRDDDLTQAFEEITAQEDAIRALREEIAKKRNKKICPTCGANCDEKFPYCPHCGTKLD